MNDPTIDHQRRRLLRLLAGSALLLPLGALAAGERPVNPTIFRLKGTAKVNDKPVNEGTLIRLGDKIETGADSEMVFVVGKDAFLARSNSKLEVSGDSGLVTALKLVSGAVLSVHAPGEKRIETPVATLGIRGTGVYTEADDQESYFCTCYGHALIAANDDPKVSREVTTTHHESPVRVMRRGQGVELRDARMINHTDAELVLLESIVGRKPPFEAQGYNDYRY